MVKRGIRHSFCDSLTSINSITEPKGLFTLSVLDLANRYIHQYTSEYSRFYVVSSEVEMILTSLRGRSQSIVRFPA